MTTNNATHDAWILGEHPLDLAATIPADVYATLGTRLGDVLVHTRRANGKWVVLAREDFDLQYEWVDE